MTITTTKSVTVYSRPGCVQCTATYRALDRKGVTYKPVDVDQTPGADELLRELGYQQLPVVIVTGTPGADSAPTTSTPSEPRRTLKGRHHAHTHHPNG